MVLEEVGGPGCEGDIPSATVTTNNNFLFTELSKVTKTNDSYKAAATLLDTSKWSTLAKTGYVDNVNTSVIGSPTLEMWIASMSEKYNDDGLTGSYYGDTNGYGGLNWKYFDEELEGRDTLYFPHDDTLACDWNGIFGYWLAAPAENYSMYMVVNSLYIRDGGVLDYNFPNAVRPIVELKSGIKATKDANNIWQLEN